MNSLITLLMILSGFFLFAFISVYFAAGKQAIHLIGIIVSALALGLVMYFSDRRAKTKGDRVSPSSKFVYALVGGVVVTAVSILLSSVFRIAPVLILILLIVVPYAIKGYRAGGS